MHKQRYPKRKQMNKVVRIRMIETYDTYIEGQEYTVDSNMADFLVTRGKYAVKIG